MWSQPGKWRIMRTIAPFFWWRTPSSRLTECLFFHFRNLYTSRENTNANGYLTSRFTMAVAAVGKDGKHASYSSTGSSVFISAPGGDIESVSNSKKTPAVLYFYRRLALTQRLSLLPPLISKILSLNQAVVATMSQWALLLQLPLVSHLRKSEQYSQTSADFYFLLAVSQPFGPCACI